VRCGKAFVVWPRPLAGLRSALWPMISGRGLGGITGGTLDKLEAIPGEYHVGRGAVFARGVRELACAICQCDRRYSRTA